MIQVSEVKTRVSIKYIDLKRFFGASSWCLFSAAFAIVKVSQASINASVYAEVQCVFGMPTLPSVPHHYNKMFLISLTLTCIEEPFPSLELMTIM